jgi:hypothetical protein
MHYKLTLKFYKPKPKTQNPKPKTQNPKPKTRSKPKIQAQTILKTYMQNYNL